MQLEFFGAAGEVTGSCHILRVGRQQLLLDCGLIQGGGDAEQRNRRDFPFEAGAIDAVVLSHAHIDHCGRLPLLVKRGYRGPVYTSRATRELLPILLEDSARLAERDAERNGRAPLFSVADVAQTLRLVKVLPYDEQRRVVPGVTVCLRDAGHIMGSASVELWLEELGVQRKLVFSGDLGQYDSPILLDPYRMQDADLVVMESTYGDRLHRSREATEQELGEIVAMAVRDGGNLVIPAFAVGRSQDLLYLFGKYYERWQLDRWQIFLDSPMAIEASAVYWRHIERHDQEALRLREEFGAMPGLPNLVLSRTSEESRAINARRTGAIIIAGSGMCNGGRILYHLKHSLGRSECHVVITGFQAPGTLGRALVDRRSTVRIHGESIAVAARIHTLGGLSAHGDQDDLVRWYGSFEKRPPVWLVHGEPHGAQGLAARLGAMGARITIAQAGEIVDFAALPASDPGAPQPVGVSG
ncbi:MAG: MBL fold metallo-hydrolase [Gammaproteobacteria bacterium]|nr:MBL fold metallo-hydrolase [Gammaproteobacteria bacterium]